MVEVIETGMGLPLYLLSCWVTFSNLNLFLNSPYLCLFLCKMEIPGLFSWDTNARLWVGKRGGSISGYGWWDKHEA